MSSRVGDGVHVVALTEMRQTRAAACIPSPPHAWRGWLLARVFTSPNVMSVRLRHAPCLPSQVMAARNPNLALYYRTLLKQQGDARATARIMQEQHGWPATRVSYYRNHPRVVRRFDKLIARIETEAKQTIASAMMKTVNRLVAIVEHGKDFDAINAARELQQRNWGLPVSHVQGTVTIETELLDAFNEGASDVMPLDEEVTLQ